jgi:hypothetical protein
MSLNLWQVAGEEPIFVKFRCIGQEKKMKRLLLFIPLFFALLACNFTARAGLDLTPTSPNVQATFTPEPSKELNATITGKLSYPSEFLPPMRVVAFSLTDQKAYFIDTAKGQGQFSLKVPAGTYYLVSYPYEGNAGNTGQADSYVPGGGPFAGGYTQMVPCGLTAGCDDHTLLPIAVAEGQTITADPGDWYAPEGTFPSMPEP